MLDVPYEKTCKGCDKPFSRPTGLTHAAWAKRRYCTQPCYLATVRVVGRTCSTDGCTESVKRGLCSTHQHERLVIRREANPRTCIVEECSTAVRSTFAVYCEKHYYRYRRTGGTGLAEPQPYRTHSQGYALVWAPDHPLKKNGTRVYEHRKVLYDAIGPGEHECYWCGKRVGWCPAPGVKRLDVDHVNGKRDDNRLENLVPSCRGCNFGRSGNPESSITQLAARRVLERHKDEFKQECDRISGVLSVDAESVSVTARMIRRAVEGRRP